MPNKRSRSKLFLLPLLLAVTAGSAFAQAAVITGQVSSDLGHPLDLANVYIVEMSVAVVTDAAGRYTLTIPAERARGQAVVLRVRRIGYTPQTMPITITPGPQTRDFVLKADVNRLSDVVITGATAGLEQKKLPFAATSLTTADMPVASSNALATLQGKVPGAQIVMPSGRPGQAPSIVLRGPKSLNANGRAQGPLIIVDGILLDGGTSDLNPLDIENVEIIKGAAASSLYGSNAAAGVIQITTKSGRNAPAGVRFNVRNEFGFSDVQGRYPFSERTMMMMDETGTKICVRVTGQPACSRVVDFEEEALRVNSNSEPFSLAPLLFEQDYGISAAPPRQHLKGNFQVRHWPKRYDPMEQVVTNGITNQTNLDMSGRFGGTGFFVSASRQIDEGAIMFLKGFNRYSGRVNLDQVIGEHWNVQLNTFYSRSQTYPDGNWFRVTRVPTGVDLLRRDQFGRLFIRSNPQSQGSQNQNPLYDHENFYSLTEADRYLGSLTTRYAPLDWLDFQANASMDRRRSNNTSMTERGYRTTASNTGNLGAISANSGASASYNFSLNGTARHRFGSDLNSTVNARYGYEQQDDNGVSGSGSSLAVPGLRTIGNSTVSRNAGSSESTVRAIGASLGSLFEYKERYILDASLRLDGSSLFGSDQRWHTYERGSLAWVVSDEPMWPWVDAFNFLKLRGSVGTAGGRPSFAAQYETFSVGTGGVITAQNLGNKDLRPEKTTETELGFDAEVLGRYGVNLTYARSITRDQILPVPPSVSSGFSSQWQNAGTLDGKTWELSLNVPIVSRRDFDLSSRMSWDQTRTFITELGVPAFFQSSSSSTFRFAQGERLGDIYGKRFVRNCSELPGQYASQCGPGQEWQRNDEGYVVWVGAGNTPGEGITKNLWQATRLGCIVNGVPTDAITGEVACLAAGGVVNNPWGQPEVHWGMLQVMRDSNASPELHKLGNTLPKYRMTFAQNMRWKRIHAYALVDRSVGNRLMNEELHWSLGDFMVREQSQTGKSVQTAKPLGYYWRAPKPDHSAGVGGFYDVLGANMHTVEDGSYTKIRELSLSVDIGEIPYVAFGSWSATLTGRNLYTFTQFKGWDPEVGTSGGNLNSSALNAVATYQYPQTRSFAFTINSRF